jgi:hypothetical protein
MRRYLGRRAYSGEFGLSIMVRLLLSCFLLLLGKQTLRCLQYLTRKFSWLTEKFIPIFPQQKGNITPLNHYGNVTCNLGVSYGNGKRADSQMAGAK